MADACRRDCRAAGLRVPGVEDGGGGEQGGGGPRRGDARRAGSRRELPYQALPVGAADGLGEDGRIEPKLPVGWVPPLFGDGTRITLQLADQRITLVRPATLDGDLLVSASQRREGNETIVALKAIHSDAAPLRTDAPLYAPAMPDAPVVTDTSAGWKVSFNDKGVLYVDGRRVGPVDGSLVVPKGTSRQCFRLTRVADDGLESLPSQETCKGDETRIAGQGAWQWRAESDGRFAVALAYANNHGPINTGITAAVKQLMVRCDGQPPQSIPLVMPHSVGIQRSTTGSFVAHAGAVCRFSLEQGFNMSYLRHNAHYTGNQGGTAGPLNQADIDALLLSPAPAGATP